VVGSINFWVCRGFSRLAGEAAASLSSLCKARSCDRLLYSTSVTVSLYGEHF
jgi:hypothetical protein